MDYTHVLSLKELFVYNYVYVCASACGYVHLSAVASGGRMRSSDPLGTKPRFSAEQCPVISPVPMGPF